jgi:hypothetical protein
MASHETRFNGEVHASRNQALAAEALRDLDKQRSVAVAAPAPIDEPKPEYFADRREVNGHVYTLDKAPDDKPMFRTATDFERNVMRHALPRVQLLLSKFESGPFGTPSWRMRALAAFYFKTKSLEAAHSNKQTEAELYERIYQQDLYDLLEASNQPFGDWRKSSEPGPKIVVAV